jgi:hypothetical protein
MKKHSVLISLLSLVAIAVAVRWYLLPTHLFFGPEQGRDFLVIEKIVRSHTLTLIGSKTDVDGVFHGPIFYYLSAIPFLLSGGDPLFVSFFLIVLHALGIVAIYFLGTELDRQRTGLIAAALYALSFHAIEYARWLSNPGLTLPLSALFFLFLVRSKKRSTWWFVPAAIAGAWLGQAEFINFVFVTPILILSWALSYKTVGFTVSSLVSAGTFAFFSGVNYLLFDLRHDHLITNGIMALLSGKTGDKVTLFKSVTESTSVFGTLASRTFGVEYSVFPLLIGVLILIGAVLLSVKKQQHALSLWLFVPIIVLAVLRHGILTQIYGFCVVGMILSMAYLISEYAFRKTALGIGVLLFFVVTNLTAWQKNMPGNNVFFQSTQPGMRYSDMKKSVDMSYTWAGKQPFSIQAYTIPYFWQDAWIYLFSWYGKKAYGYAPVSEKAPKLFVIMQKDNSSPGYQDAWYKNTVSTWGEKGRSATYGEITVEERIVPLSKRL